MLIKNNKTVKKSIFKSHNHSLKNKTKKHHHVENEYTLTQFKIYDENIEKIKRNYKSPTDCVINAMEIIGMLDFYSANLLRISCVGQGSGIDQYQIKKIFSLYYGYDYVFKEIKSYIDFIKIINTELEPGNVLFAGYRDIKGFKHVFLIGRLLSGDFVYIDSQTVDPMCNLTTNPDCENFINNKLNYYILKNGNHKLSKLKMIKYGFQYM